MGKGGRFALALGSLALALVLAEAFLRLSTWPRPMEGLRALHEVRPDRAWLYGLRPGAHVRLRTPRELEYVINGQGFRDREHPVGKAPGSYRILVLGDSVTFGYGVPGAETFPGVLESMLGDGFEVLNLGVGGYNPYNEAALLRDVGPGYEPDLVLVQFCVNDLNDPTLHFDAQTRLQLGAIPDAAFPDPGDRRAASPSPLIGACFALRVCTLVHDALVALSARALEGEVLRAALAPASSLPEGPVRRWLAARYGEMRSEAESIGAEFAVVAFPHRGQLEGIDARALQGDLVGLGNDAGWTTLDLLPDFLATAAVSDEPLFLDLWHPTGAGHRVAAAGIARGLERAGLLPEGG
jgi:lysophospholipase L1-like esterase